MTAENRPRLPPGQQLIRTDRWPVVGERAPREDSSPWIITTAGLVAAPRQWSLDQLIELPQVERALDIHCVTRWSRFDVVFGGVPLASILPPSSILPEARYVSFVARSQRRHSTSLAIDELWSAEPLVVLRENGAPLPVEHGGPVRIVAPGKYFYKSIKWLEQIECLPLDRLGYWESDAGYHNGADPWREERYIAAGISKQQAAKLIASRNFTGLNLLSIDATKHDLSGLVAQRAALRNAHFVDAKLIDADFSDANLSNAHFDRSDLRGACFMNADVEGASFAGADLRGVDLRVASMFGASFCELDPTGQFLTAARLDASTQVDRNQLATLTAEQEQFMRSQLGD